MMVEDEMLNEGRGTVPALRGKDFAAAIGVGLLLVMLALWLMTDTAKGEVVTGSGVVSAVAIEGPDGRRLPECAGHLQPGTPCMWTGRGVHAATVFACDEQERPMWTRGFTIIAPEDGAYHHGGEGWAPLPERFTVPRQRRMKVWIETEVTLGEDGCDALVRTYREEGGLLIGDGSCEDTASVGWTDATRRWAVHKSRASERERRDYELHEAHAKTCAVRKQQEGGE